MTVLEARITLDVNRALTLKSIDIPTAATAAATATATDTATATAAVVVLYLTTRSLVTLALVSIIPMLVDDGDVEAPASYAFPDPDALATPCHTCGRKGC